MATLTLQKVPANGLDVTFTAAAGGGDAVPGGADGGGWSLPRVLLVRNGGASPINVTVAGQSARSVAAGGQGVFQIIGGVYAGALVGVTYSAVTSVTVAAVDLTE